MPNPINGMFKKCCLLLFSMIVAGCSGPAANPTPTAQQNAALATQPPANQTTPPPATPAALATLPASSTPTTGTTPTLSVPTSTVVDRLPLDQVWISRPNNDCGYTLNSGVRDTVPSQTLAAIDQAGNLQELRTPILRILQASGRPPVLVTCEAGNEADLIDTATWKQVTFEYPRTMRFDNMRLDSTGHQLAFALPDDGLYMTNITTGETTPLLDAATVQRTMESEYGIYLLGWIGNTLYMHGQSSGTARFWRIDTPTANPAPEEILVIGNSGSWSLSPAGDALLWTALGNPTKLRNLSTGKDRSFEPAASVQQGLFTPDGTGLAVLATLSGACCELIIYDLAADPPAMAPTGLTTANFDPANRQDGWVWSADQQYLLFSNEVGERYQSSVFDRRGQRLADLNPIPAADIRGAPRFTAAGEVVQLLSSGDQVVFRTTSLKAGTPSIQELELPEQAEDADWRQIVYLPAR